MEKEEQMGKEASAAASRVKRPSKLLLPRVATKPSVDGSSCVVSAKPNGCLLSDNDGPSAILPHSDWMSRIGSRVCVGGAKMGILLFFGETQFADGVWCGVVLDEPVGKNDGTVSGVRYFTCDQDHGIFAPPHKVHLDNDSKMNNGIDSKRNDTFVRSFDSVCEGGRKTWPPLGRPKSTNLSENPSGSSTKQNGSASQLTTTKLHAPKRTSSPSTLGIARSSKIRSKSKSPAANLDATVILAKTTSKQKADMTFCTFQSEAGPANSTFTAATTNFCDGTFVHEQIVCEGDHCGINVTFTASTNDAKLDGTFSVNDTDVRSADRCDVVRPLSTIQEAEDQKLIVGDPFSIDDIWKFDENYDDDGGLFCSGNDDDDGCGIARQGSLELDESLGILTPDQMRDFTLAADTIVAQTPSDEGIQEIVDDEVADTNDEGVAFTTTEVQIDNLVSAAPAVETTDLDTHVTFDKLTNRVGKCDYLANSSDFEATTCKTSTPFRKEDWVGTVPRGISEETVPVSKFDSSHFSFTYSPVVSSASFGTSRTGKLSTLLELDVSNISTVTTVHQVSETSLTDVTTNFSKGDRNLANLTVGVEAEAVAKVLDADSEPLSSVNVKTDPPRLAEESVAVNMAKQLSFAVKMDVAESLPVVQTELPNGSNMDGAVEFLLQHMSRNFVEHVVENKREQPVSEMAVSVTSIDTGYQGDAECDLQSDAGTNAANTPVEDGHRKEIEMAALVEVGKHLKGGDPGSDSDFCSDMATSLTESEMEGEDRGGRGRGARVIDGRLYYSNASISKDTEVTASNECVSSETMEKSGLEVVSSMAVDKRENLVVPDAEVASETASVSAATVLDSSTDCDSTPRNSTTVLEVEETEKQTKETEKQTKETDESEVQCITEPVVIPDVLECPSTVAANDLETSQTCDKHPNDQTSVSFDDKTKGAAAELAVVGERMTKNTTPKRESDATRDKKGKTASAEKSKKGLKKESPSSASKKPKTPRKNVMSKIKAMIEATSNILTSKDQLPAIASGCTTADASNEDVGKKSTRAPKRSRWDAVMSKIAAGQAEEKVKTKKEVTSRVNTNLTSGSKLNVFTKSSRSEVSPKVPDAKSTTTKQNSKLSCKQDSSCGIRKPMTTTTRGSVGGASSDAADVSLQSHSERSSLQRASKLPRSAKLPRPSTLNIGQPNAAAASAVINSRSPSQVSVMSGMSTLSQLTLASQASTRPPQDVSLASCDRSHGRSSHSLKPISGPPKKVSSSPRAALPPLPPAVPQMGTRRTMTLGHSSSNVRETSGLKRSLAAKARSPGSHADSVCSAAVRPKPLSRFGGAEMPQHKTNRKDQGGGQLRSLKTSSGLVKAVPQQDNRLHSTVARTEATVNAAREVSRLEALCEARTKELNYVRMQLKHCAVGFDSLAVLVQYLTQELNAFSMPDLTKQLKEAEEEFVATKADLEDTRGKQIRLQDEISNIQDLHFVAMEEIATRMSKEVEDSCQNLIRKHLNEVDKIVGEHRAEIQSLRETHVIEIAKTTATHEAQMTVVNAAHDDARNRLEEQRLSEKEELTKSHKAEMNSLISKHEQVERLLQDRVADLMEQCEALQIETQSLKEELMSDSDYRVQSSSNRCRALQNEVDSLKSVLEMRQTEMQDLRREKLELKCQAEELSLARDKIKKLEAKNEDLRAMMDIRVKHERQLSSERQVLIENYEKESKVSKRLSMENEELQWRLQQNKETQNYLSSIEGTSDSFSKGGDPTPPGSMSMYFWDNEGLLNSSMNGSCLAPKTSFTCFKGPHSTAWPATSPMSCSSPKISPRISPCKSPSNGRSLSAPVAVTRDDFRNQKPSTSEDECLLETNFVRLREKPKKRTPSRHSHVVDFRVNMSSSSPNTNKAKSNGAKNPSEIESVSNDVDAINGECISEDILVANEAFTEAEMFISEGFNGDCNLRDIFEYKNGKSEYHELGSDCCGVMASERSLELPRLCKELQNADLTDSVHVSDFRDETAVTSNVDYNLADSVPKMQSDLPNGNCESPNVKVGFDNGVCEEEQQDSASIESSGSGGVPADDISSGKDPISIESYENVHDSTQLSPFSSPDHQHVTKSTTTVVISFRSNRHSIGSSRASSPLPQLLGMSTTGSESCESQSSESSSRASPLGREQLSNKQLQLLDGSLFDGFRSPRISAGESMVLDDFASSGSQPDPSHVLLKKALQDQLLHGNRDSSCDSMSHRESLDSYAREVASLDGSPLPGISKPDTPESTSQAVAPTDSSNADLSFSDDDLASETEV